MLTIVGGILLAVLVLVFGGAGLIVAIVALVILAFSLESTGIAWLIAIAVILGLALGYVNWMKPKGPLAEAKSEARAKNGSLAPPTAISTRPAAFRLNENRDAGRGEAAAG